MYYDLPPVEPVTQIQEERRAELVDRFETYSKHSEERTMLTFLIQVNIFNELAESSPDTKWGDNYAVQAWRNYEAYLRYLNL